MKLLLVLACVCVCWAAQPLNRGQCLGRVNQVLAKSQQRTLAGRLREKFDDILGVAGVLECLGETKCTSNDATQYVCDSVFEPGVSYEQSMGHALIGLVGAVRRYRKLGVFGSRQKAACNVWYAAYTHGDRVNDGRNRRWIIPNIPTSDALQNALNLALGRQRDWKHPNFIKACTSAKNLPTLTKTTFDTAWNLLLDLYVTENTGFLWKAVDAASKQGTRMDAREGACPCTRRDQNPKPTIGKPAVGEFEHMTQQGEFLVGLRIHHAGTEQPASQNQRRSARRWAARQFDIVMIVDPAQKNKLETPDQCQKARETSVVEQLIDQPKNDCTFTMQKDHIYFVTGKFVGSTFFIDDCAYIRSVSSFTIALVSVEGMRDWIDNHKICDIDAARGETAVRDRQVINEAIFSH